MDRNQFQKVAAAVFIFIFAACDLNTSQDSQSTGAGLVRDGRLRAGFAKTEITPLVVEGYEDANGNDHYDTGEKQIDANGNGVWEPAWIAGFSNGRAAQGVHDPLWARTLALSRDGTVLTFTVMDLVGMLPTRMVSIREQVRARVGKKFDLQDHEIILATTHTHESPDTMGIWGEALFVTGINEAYMQYIVEQAAASIVAALEAMEPVSVKFGYARAATGINDDSRYPYVIDDDIYAAQFVREDGTTAGSLLEYSMHPEVLWSRNTQITSDYPHFVRERLEKELGGTAIFATGMVGGLMTPKSDVHTFEQAESVGSSLADSAIAALESAETHADCALETHYQTVHFPVANATFRIMIENKILDAGRDDLDFSAKGCANDGCVYVDVVAANLCGVAQLATVPGELFPELAVGGFAQPLEWDGDYAAAPTGTPLKESLEYPNAATENPFRTVSMQGQYRFVFGLANGELGYIVPKSQWDPEDYEETVSLGPDTAPLLSDTLEAVLAPLRK